MTAPIVVRRLMPEDAKAFRTIRLEGLQDAPTAFGSSYEAEKDRTEAEFAAMLTNSYVAGAWSGDALVGVAGFYTEAGSKVAHRGKIWGVFVTPTARDAGVGRALLNDVLAHARTRVEQVHLSVVTENEAATALYAKLGFAVYGTEPRGLLVDGRYLDEHLMVLRFPD